MPTKWDPGNSNAAAEEFAVANSDVLEVVFGITTVGRADGHACITPPGLLFGLRLCNCKTVAAVSWRIITIVLRVNALERHFCIAPTSIRSDHQSVERGLGC